MEKICSLMGLDNLIEDLPEGIDTVIGEGATLLAEGKLSASHLLVLF